MNASPFLNVSGLYKNFGGVRAINDLSFELEQGELLGLIGPNGSGKTTAVNLITGFVKPTEGEILYRGRNITGLPPYKIVRIGIARTFQMVKPFYQLPAYKNMMQMNGMGGHGVDENFPRSQAIKDATMAHFILEHLDTGTIFVHFNGSYHSDNHEGIVWYLEQYRQGLTVYTISSVRQDSIDTLDEDNAQVADFIIAVPSSMTNTY